MAWLMIPEGTVSTMPSGHIVRPMFRIVLCVVAVLVVVAALSLLHVQQDRLLSAALNLFLVVVLIGSIRWGTRYAIFLSLLCPLAFSWLLAGTGHFHFADGRVWTLLAACLVTGLFASRLSDRVRRAVLVANQRRAEAAAEQQRFMDLVNSVEGIVWEADAETFVFSFVSEQAERVLGYPTERWLNEPAFWKDHLHPEDRDRAVQFCLQAAAEKCGHDFEYRMMAADGRMVWLRDLVTVVAENGRATRLRGVMIDITKRKQDEGALLEQAKLLSLTHDAILVRDMNGLTKFWNRGAELLYGWAAEQAIGRVLFDLLNTVFPAPLEEIEGEVLRTGHWEGELVQTKKDGTQIVVSSRWALQRDERGAPLAILVTNNDISERKQAEQRLRVAMSERTRLGAFREEIRMALAHEGSLSEILQNCAEAILRHFGAAFARIWTLSSKGRELQLKASAGMYTRLDGTHSRIPIGHLKIGLIAEERKPYLSNDVQNDPLVDKDWARREGMVSFAGYPLVVEDRIVGVMALFSQKPLLETAGETLAFVADAVAQGIGRKRAEEAVRRSEKDLRDVINTVPANVWSALPDGAIDFVNQRWQELAGLPVQDALGWNWENVVHPDDRTGFVADWRSALQSGQPMENEIRIRRGDGEYRWWLIRNVPLRDELGNVVKWYGTGMDIDDRKRAEALLAGEKRILEMVARADSLSEILDKICLLVEQQASGVLASIVLLDGDHLRHGGAPSLPKAYTDAIDGAAIGPSAGSCGTAAYRGEQVIVEDIATDSLWANYRALALPHSLRACWSTPVFSSQGKVIATFAMYYRECRRPSSRDQEVIEQSTHLVGLAIERKLTQDKLGRSESYLAEAQRLTHTGSWVWRVEDRNAVHLSEEWYRIYGFNPAEGMPVWDTRLERIHPEDRARWKGTIERAILEKTDYDVEFRIVLPGGITKWIHTVGHPILTSTGDLVEFVGSSTDVTERKRAEEERERLHQLEADLAHINRVSMMGELTASLAHEIKQPITAAATNAETCLRWLKREPAEIERARAAVSRIAQDVNRAAEIINRVRALYTKGVEQRELVNVNEMIEEMIVLFRNEASRVSISIRSDLADLSQVTADRVQLQQVLMNLLLNGIEAMKDREGELTIRSRQNEDGQVLISVCDNGVGLPAEKVDQIFDAFFTTKPQGTGMGLAITRSIVEAHGGRLWATANPGRGATFHLTLPVTTDECS
jgi:PAS domain S-box-containing protein